MKISCVPTWAAPGSARDGTRPLPRIQGLVNLDDRACHRMTRRIRHAQHNRREHIR